MGKCREFGCLPRSGGLLDQSTEFLELLAIEGYQGEFQKVIVDD